MDPSRIFNFLEKDLRCVPFQPLLAFQNSRPELISPRRKCKKYVNFSIALIHFSILFLQNLFNATCSDPQIFNFMVSKIIFPSIICSFIFDNLLMVHRVFSITFIFTYICPIDLLLSSQFSISFQEGPVAQQVQFCL